MTKKEIILAIFEDMKLVWNDPDPIEGNDYTIKNRFSGVGILSKEDAWNLGAVGPTLRASDVAQDMRKLGYAVYGNLDFEPVTEKSCD